jgi:hypothetical protein
VKYRCGQRRLTGWKGIKTHADLKVKRTRCEGFVNC